jgi:hypothetical protein
MFIDEWFGDNFYKFDRGPCEPVFEANSVSDILTFNTRDFERYPGVTVLVPTRL